MYDSSLNRWRVVSQKEERYSQYILWTPAWRQIDVIIEVLGVEAIDDLLHCPSGWFGGFIRTSEGGCRVVEVCEAQRKLVPASTTLSNSYGLFSLESSFIASCAPMLAWKWVGIRLSKCKQHELSYTSWQEKSSLVMEQVLYARSSLYRHRNWSVFSNTRDYWKTGINRSLSWLTIISCKI